MVPSKRGTTISLSIVLVIRLMLSFQCQYHLTISGSFRVYKTKADLSFSKQEHTMIIIVNFPSGCRQVGDSEKVHTQMHS